MKFLCKIGLHKYETIAKYRSITSMVFTGHDLIVQQCIKCLKYRSSIPDMCYGGHYFVNGNLWQKNKLRRTKMITQYNKTFKAHCRQNLQYLTDSLAFMYWNANDFEKKYSEFSISQTFDEVFSTHLNLDDALVNKIIIKPEKIRIERIIRLDKEEYSYRDIYDIFEKLLYDHVALTYKGPINN